MNMRLTSRRQRMLYVLAAALLALGFLCQVLVLDHWVAPLEAAGSDHGSPTQFCHGSLSNCAGTVDVGSTLHAKLAPPIPPATVPGALDLAFATPPAAAPLSTDPPPRSI